MDETTIHTLVFKGRHFLLSAEEAGKYLPEHVKDWVFRHPPYTVDAAIKVGRLVAETGLLSSQGVGDAEALAVARGKAIAEAILKEWGRKSDDGSPLPVTSENIGSLPPPVLKAFAQRVERGIVPTDGELEAMKRPTETSASTG